MDEQFPQASEEWAGKWTRSPMRHFGRTARIAFRQTFRDLLGDIRIEEEIDERDLPPGSAAPTEPAASVPAAARDWESEYLAATTTDQIDAPDRDARAVRAFTPDKAGTALHRIARDQRKALVEAAWALDHADATEAPAPAAAPAVERPALRDFLPPQNRAERRAAARKKKGRR